jgi:hypothetical protein
MRKLFMADLNTKVAMHFVLNARTDGRGRKKERNKERKKERETHMRFTVHLSGSSSTLIQSVSFYRPKTYNIRHHRFIAIITTP